MTENMFVEISCLLAKYRHDCLEAEIMGDEPPPMPDELKYFEANIRERYDIRQSTDLFCPKCGRKTVVFYPNRDEDNYLCELCDLYFNI